MARNQPIADRVRALVMELPAEMKLPAEEGPKKNGMAEPRTSTTQTSSLGLEVRYDYAPRNTQARFDSPNLGVLSRTLGSTG